MRSTGSTRDSKILLIDPASRPPYGRVRLRKRHTVTFSTLRMTHKYSINAQCKSINNTPSLKVFEGWGYGGRKTFFKKFPSPAYYPHKLLIKPMRTDTESKGSIFRYPVRRSVSGIYKEEYIIGKRIALKTYLCGNDALGSRRVIDSSVGNG